MNSMKPLVLILDDEKDIREICHGIISRSFECKVISNSSVSEATTSININKFDVAILDVHLQDGVGFGLIPLLRKKNPEVKILTITAYNQCSEVQKARNLSVDAFLGKPFTATQLINELDRWL